MIVNAALNYFAAALAGASNVALMRSKEITEGIDIKDAKGEKVLGRSKIAAKRAVRETALTRMVLPAPVLFFPAVASALLNKFHLFPKHVVGGKLVEAALCVFSLSVALPMSIALFQQESSTALDKLEEEFRDLKDEDGAPIKFAYYNKGA